MYPRVFHALHRLKATGSYQELQAEDLQTAGVRDQEERNPEERRGTRARVSTEAEDHPARAAAAAKHTVSHHPRIIVTSLDNRSHLLNIRDHEALREQSALLA